MSFKLSASAQAELNRGVQRLADAAGSTAKEVLPQQMRLYAADLAFNTRPIGKDKGGKKKGDDAVGKRIGAIYKPVGKACEWLEKKNPSLAIAFSRMVRKRQFSQAAALLNKHTSDQYQYDVGVFDGGRLHEQQKDSGRAKRALIVTNFKAVETYAKKVQKRVGFAKGAFATAARQLGGVRGIPGYATRQNSPGTGTVNASRDRVTVVMTNDVDYISEALDPRGEEAATKNRKRSVDLVIKRMMSRKTKTASRSLK